MAGLSKGNGSGGSANHINVWAAERMAANRAELEAAQIDEASTEVEPVTDISRTEGFPKATPIIRQLGVEFEG